MVSAYPEIRAHNHRTTERIMKNTDYNRIVGIYPRLAAEYAPKPDVFDDDEPRVSVLKRAVSRLPEDDRRVIILYSELQSVRALGAALGMSHMSAQRRVRRIKERIFHDIKKSA